MSQPRVLAAWAASLTTAALIDRMRLSEREPRRFDAAERRALMAEAADRLEQADRIIRADAGRAATVAP